VLDVDAVSPLLKVASRSDAVVDTLRDAILSGQIKPGEVLVERQLAELMGVSKTPVREALITLTASGLVTTTTNYGARARELTLSDIKQVYQFRLLLEPWAIGEAARRQPKDHIERARAALADAVALIDSNDVYALNLANRRFHHELYSGCDNALIVKRLDELQDLTSLAVLSFLWKESATWRPEGVEHELILQAVETGDAVAAREHAHQHIERTLNVLPKPQ
jgi:DNA-binding GntR family transcriptional regulator